MISQYYSSFHEVSVCIEMYTPNINIRGKEIFFKGKMLVKRS